MIERIRSLSFGVRTLEDLRAHLQVAIELEHATIPPYLCALYSISDTKNREAAQILKGVVIEEMLHLTLAANVLNAIGGKPKLNAPDFIPRYPMTLPHSEGDFSVGLEKFSRGAMETFLKIERPSTPGARPDADHYQTIGQFYAAIIHGLKINCRSDEHFTRNLQRQITPEHYYGSGGKAIVVTDLESALLALNEIVEQGEGFNEDRALVHDQDGRLGHYYRFTEIVRGRRYRMGDTRESGPTGEKLSVGYQQVYPMEPNPRLDRYPAGGELWRKVRDFNQVYTKLLDTLHESLNGQPALLMEAVGRMYDLKYRAVELMRIPFEGGVAGPSFEAMRGEGNSTLVARTN